jgi:acyl transferase domain-containing protein
LLATEGLCFLVCGGAEACGDALGHAVRGTGKRPTVLGSLGGADEDPRRQALTVAGALYALGHPLRWERLPPLQGRCVPLPSYPWQRQRFWIDAVATPAPTAPRPAAVTAASPPPPPAPLPQEALPSAAALQEQLRALPADQRPALLLASLRAITCDVVRLPPASLASEQPLRALGIDSILIAELQSRIQDATGVRLPLEQMLDGPPLTELSERILKII